MDKFVTFQIPVLFSGPYSYDGSPIEKIFASIKMRDLNPKAMSFKSRQTIETYVQWLTEEIVKINFGNVSTLFKQALEANKSYLLFNDIWFNKKMLWPIYFIGLFWFFWTFLGIH